MGSSIGNNARPVRGDGHPNGRRLAPRSRWRLRRLPALALVCLAAASSGQADAEVAVDGGRHEMHVNVTNDTVGHVLEALSEKGTLRFRSTAPLDKVIGGSFSGTLGQVVSQVLTGFDFVIVDKPQSVEIVVFEESGAKPISPSDVASAQPQMAPPPTEKAAPVSPTTRDLPPRAPRTGDTGTPNLSQPH